MSIMVSLMSQEGDITPVESIICKILSLMKIAGKLSPSTTTQETAIFDSILKRTIEYCFANGIFMLRNNEACALEKKESNKPQNIKSSHIKCGQVDALPVKLAPISLFPSIFPSETFHEVYNLSSTIHELVDNMTCQPEWLNESLMPIAQYDDFVSQLLTIAKRVYIGENLTEPLRQINKDIRFHLLRSDYMLDTVNQENHMDSNIAVKQVEINTIAASFSGLSERVSSLHRFIMSKILFGQEGLEKYVSDNTYLPANLPTVNIAEAFAKAHGAYNERQKLDPSTQLHNRKSTQGNKIYPSIIIAVVNDDETNTFDQHALYSQIEEKCACPVFKATMDQLRNMFMAKTLILESVAENKADLSAGSTYCPGRLLIKMPNTLDTLNDGFYQVSILYFRTCYLPEHFKTPEIWKLRELLEVSDAVKVPNILTHLVGTKKIQQMFSFNPKDSKVLEKISKNVEYKNALLERFVKNSSDLTNVLQLHVDPNDTLFGTSNNSYYEESVRLIVEDAITYPNNYILKSQREGGGNNVYGEGVSDMLRKAESSDEIKGYIMAKRMYPPVLPALLLESVRQECDTIPSLQCQLVPSVSELGIYSAFVANSSAQIQDSIKSGNNILYDTTCGYLLRTKSSSSDEGGVAAGYGKIDSALLVEKEVLLNVYLKFDALFQGMDRKSK